MRTVLASSNSDINDASHEHIVFYLKIAKHM